MNAAAIDRVLALEAELRQAGISVSELGRRADLPSGLWWKWKYKNVCPRRTTWARVQAAADALLAEHRAA